MKRRYFFKYTASVTTGLALGACKNWFNSNNAKEQNIPNFGKLEKTYITLGYLPTLDATPLIIAQEKGFFARYGLTVGFSRQLTPNDLENGLSGGKLDGAVAPFPLPLLSAVSKKITPMVSLMTLNLNGSAITLSQKSWLGGIRPITDYYNFREFANSYRRYIRNFNTPQSFAIASNTSMDNYLYRYWLAAMGINPDQEIKLTEIAPSQMIYKLQAGSILGYAVADPWNQQAVLEKAGFIADVTRNIWQGHPNKVLATTQSWLKNNPVTARALMAALIEACQYCDTVENRPEIAQIIAQNKYLNTSLTSLEPGLLGNYNYSSLDNNNRQQNLADFNIFSFQETNYLKQPNHVNYPWRSHGVWLLTQIVRWHQADVSEYPKDADKILDETYPIGIYEEVAKALEIKLPEDKLKKEPATVFIDQREFDPSEPVAYLNHFELRA
ncbi:CmpA/NrtA family ABC transporter substrate-binding protein [Gloeothece citriformis]|nr:CmpA/NrtA family ABC transporter substrate-binding protein [Gloeothece citriformis]